MSSIQAITGNGNIQISGIKAILFDLDGTLIDSLDLHIQSFQWILKKLGKDIKIDQLEGLMGLTPQDIIRNFFTDLNMDEIWAAAIAKESYLGTIIKKVYVYPGIHEFLVLLGQLGIKKVVISSTHRKLVDLLLEKAGLLEMVDEIVSGDEITHGKPHPEPFVKGAVKLGLDVSETIGIGDSIFDAQSCEAGGIKFIGILTGKTKIDEFRQNGYIAIESISNILINSV